MSSLFAKVLNVFVCVFAISGSSLFSDGPKDWQEYFNQDVESFFEISADRVTIAFFPKKCVFDKMVEDPSCFLDVGEFKVLAKEWGYRVVSCGRQPQWISFADREELESFVKETFNSHLKEGEHPLKFLSRVIIAELERQE